MIDVPERIRMVFDDGGFPNDLPDGRGLTVGLAPYERLVELARRHELVVPIAVTAAFIDVNNIAGLDRAHRDAGKIIRLLRDNARHVPVWNHGLTHTFGDHLVEFDTPSGSPGVPESTQHEHLDASQRIFEDVGLARPTVFVPPGHLWEPGVTDRLASELGFRHIAIREFEKSSVLQWLRRPRHAYTRRWTDSQYLKTLYRHGLGIPFDTRRLGPVQLVKTKQYIRPANRLVHYLVFRTWGGVRPPHHYFAHIQNLGSDSHPGFWDRVIPYIRSRTALERR